MKRRLIAVLAAAIASLASVAAASELRCPPEIAVDQKATEPPSGWTVSYNGFRNELAGVTIYDGPPEQGASLVYDDEKSGGGIITQTWNLQPNPRGYWMMCGYTNTSAQLTARVAGDQARCEVVFEKNVRFGDGRKPVRKAVCAPVTK
jgi:hypothetical protein